ncbi:unnamed protein product [Clonostachys rosea f. rosea IK726]|uniref:Uncharacterized protein n=1 Tax=Clonostachys rosea f. rosea IK726 TaxID=1349383 RepID=A0ACA9UCD9_BIOOC|nr:unnamed protein product [Clonostachys rosea f. rosea IK726]
MVATVHSQLMLIILSGLGFSYIAGFAVYNVFFHRSGSILAPLALHNLGPGYFRSRWKNTLYTANPAI